MRTDGLPFLVVGGGIAGMSVAIALRQRGFAVDLVEIDPDWRVYGAGITITGPTYRAFSELGLLAELRERGFASVGGTRICNAAGDVLIEVPTAPIGPDIPPIGGIMRPVLHEMLSRETVARGVRVRLGMTTVAIDDGEQGVAATFADGAQGEYAAAIIADGAFSTNRAALFPGGPAARYTGQYCWRLVAERPPEIDRGHIYSAGQIFAGLVPTSPTAMYMWLLEPRADTYRIEEGREHVRLAEIMAPFAGVLGRLREGLTFGSIINVRPLDAVLVPAPWHRGRRILIGDAAHSTTPHLASGAGIAVEDAVVLATLLDRTDTVEAAFAAFMKVRWDRCRDVVESSVAIGAMQQRADASPEKLGALVGAAEHRLQADIWPQDARPTLKRSA